MIEPRLQPLTRARLRTLGPAGAAWTAALPVVLAELCEQWSLTLGRSLPGGSGSYVTSASRAGVPCVLKVVVDDVDLRDQIEVLQRAQGRGYVRLLAQDRERRALLLERLGPSLAQSGTPPEAQLAALADTLSIAWGPADRPPRAKAAALATGVADAWPRLGRPCPEHVVDHALACAERVAAVPADDLVLVHGDPHPGNLLRVLEPRPGAETGWCFVDPDGFVTDRAYDLGVALRDWCGLLLADPSTARDRLEGYAGILAERSGADPARIWDWGFLERVSTGLYVLSFGAQRVAQPFLRSAELLC